MKFFNLHQHTTYSFLDGFGLPKQITARLDNIQQDGCAITDHGNIYGHVPFWKDFHKAGKHLVLGAEFYTVLEDKRERGYFHTTVLAKTNQGYQNLLLLMNIANKQFYYKPRITFQQLSEHSAGLIILTGCFNDGWLFKNPAGFEQWVGWMKGAEWYLELQPFEDLIERWEMLVGLAERHGLPCVVTFDSHYPSPEDKVSQDFMLAINTNKPLSDPDRLKMDFPLHMPDWEDAVERCKKMGIWKEEWLSLSQSIAMSCNVELPKTSMIKLNTSISKLQRICEYNMPDWMKKDEKYQERFNYELQLIEEKGFTDYFYIIYDLMRYAKQHMLCSPGRGSSAGSLVCYLLRITEVDPLRFGLLFERFIDVNRTDLPDIDLDFAASGRDSIIKYLKKKYGSKKTMQLVTFNTYKPKAILQDGARVLQIPRWEIAEATSQVIYRSAGDSRAMFCLEDSIDQYDKMKALFIKHPKLREALKLEGQVKAIGKHAAAVAIANDDFTTIAAMKDDIISIDKYSAEEVGILKIDVLGLETLDIIQDICTEVGVDFKTLYPLPLDDQLTFEKVFTPSKLQGIFQFEGLSVRKVCEDISPTKFEHLVHITALGRPGSLNSGSTKEYIQRFRGKQFEIDPVLKPYTHDTLGCIIYQEQVMNVVRYIGKFSWDDTSTIRKAMSKNLGEEFFNKFKDKFIEGAVSQGTNAGHAEHIWNHCYQHGSWSFNKCLHKDTKIKIGMQSAYLGAEYTIEELYWKLEVSPSPWHQTHKPQLLSLYPDGRIRPHRVKRIYQNGEKPCWKLSLETTSITATEEHKILTKSGWKRLKDIKVGEDICVDGGTEKTIYIPTGAPKYRGHGKKYNAKTRKKRDSQGRLNYGFCKGNRNIAYTNGSSLKFENIKRRKEGIQNCEICSKLLSTCKRPEFHHMDGDHFNNSLRNVKKVCNSCHKKLDYKRPERTRVWGKGHKVAFQKVTAKEYYGEEMTYDIEMETHHNFIANGIITHNSHAASYALLSYWMGYCKAHWPAQFYARILRGRVEKEEILPILKEYNGKFVPIDINGSGKHFQAREDVLYGGFTNIKGIGEAAAAKLTAAQPFDSMEDFHSRIPQGIAKKIAAAISNGLDWANFTPLQEQVDLSKLVLSRQILPWKKVINDLSNNSEAVVIGKVIHTNLKDHNEEEKVQKRGFKLKGWTEYIVLKITDDDFDIFHICFDKHFTQKNKQLLLSTKGQICLFKIQKIDGNLIMGKKVKILEEKTK